jgi:hypothetical protein
LSICNPKPEEETDACMAVLLLALSGVPFGAFTAATQRDLLGRCTDRPSAADVYAVLAPVAVRIRYGIAGLKRVIAAPTKEEAAL